MKLINLTILRRKRLKIMLDHLYPEYESIRIKSNGLTDFKKKWYSLKVEQKNINVTDICIYHLPRKLDNLAREKGFGTGYINLFMHMINNILQYKVHLGYVDVMDYLWDQFQKITNREMLIKADATFKQIKVCNDTTLVIHPLSRLNLLHVRDILKLLGQKTDKSYKIRKIFTGLGEITITQVERIKRHFKIFKVTLALPSA